VENNQKDKYPHQEKSKSNSQESSENENKKEDKSSIQSPDSEDIEKSKAVSYLSYLGILFLVPFLTQKDGQFAQFHAKQGLVVCVIWFVGFFLEMTIFLRPLGVVVYLFAIILSVLLFFY